MTPRHPDDIDVGTGVRYATKFCETNEVAKTCNDAAAEGWDVQQVMPVYRGAAATSSVMVLLRREPVGGRWS